MNECRKGHLGQMFIDSRGHRDCKECRKLRTAKYRTIRHDRVIQSQRSWYRRNIEKAKEVARIKHDRRGFGGLREQVIARDGGCVSCGISREQHRTEYGRDIEVDHIDRNGLTKPVNQRNNTMQNLQTLCRKCHTSKDRKLVLAERTV